MERASLVQAGAAASKNSDREGSMLVQGEVGDQKEKRKVGKYTRRCPRRSSTLEEGQHNTPAKKR